MTLALGNNSGGQIVGYQETASVSSGWLRVPPATFTMIGASSPSTGAEGINDAGQIVGWYSDPTTFLIHGLLYTDPSIAVVTPPGSNPGTGTGAGTGTGCVWAAAGEGQGGDTEGRDQARGEGEHAATHAAMHEGQHQCHDDDSDVEH